VSAALREAALGLPGVAEYVFDRARGGVFVRQGDHETRVARGPAFLPRNAFHLSLWGRVPFARRGFLDNQNLAFLRPPGTGLCLYDLFYLTHPDNAAEAALGRLLYRRMGDYPFYLAISRYTRDIACETFRIPPERVRVIPLDCDRALFREIPCDAAELAARWGLPAGSRALLHVSSGDKRKNYRRVLEAFGMIAREFPGTVLVRIGKPLHEANRRAEQDLTRRLGIADRVFHLQGVSDEDLVRFYNTADCLVFPSLAEGFGLPVLEAQACGCPCVVSGGSALAEVAGPLATVVDPRDARDIADGIARVLRDSGLRAHEAAANRAYLARFDWGPAQRMVRGWLESGDPGPAWEPDAEGAGRDVSA